MTDSIVTSDKPWPCVIERTSGAQVYEQPWGEKALAWFYPVQGQPNWIARSLRYVLAHTSLPHHLTGLWFSRSASVQLVPEFCSTYGVRIEDFEIPDGGWSSFNEFFMRKLAPNVRPLPENPCCLACPGEGRVRAYATTPDRLCVKGQNHRLADFFDDGTLAAQFEGGPCLLVRLCPSDYHRFHFPFSGTIVCQRKIPGTLFSVHPWAELHEPDSWWKNARTLTVVDTEYGRYACVAIGATSVGSIQMSVVEGSVLTGQEWGAFAIGGSALALFFQPNTIKLDHDLITNTTAGKETLCQVLTSVGIWTHCTTP